MQATEDVEELAVHGEVSPTELHYVASQRYRLGCMAKGPTVHSPGSHSRHNHEDKAADCSMRHAERYKPAQACALFHCWADNTC